LVADVSQKPEQMKSSSRKFVSLFLCGDVMTGRGIDQILAHPVNPILHEPCASDAREYVRLAESVNGPVQPPVSFDYVWGDALTELENAAVDLRIVNLETAITSSEAYWPGKAVHYRMHPLNTRCLAVAKIDACCLANNHVLDWNHAGLIETLGSLDREGLGHCGAGTNDVEAAAPAVLKLTGQGRVLVFSFGSVTSGIPKEWGATGSRPGVNFLQDLSAASAEGVARLVGQWKQPNDIVLASIHWGHNWGYDIPEEQIAFAHRLIDDGVAIVHGHSSHHAKAIEIYRDRLILYGCGDFVTDYEGIRVHGLFRGDLALMYLAQLDSGTGQLRALRLMPLQARRLRLNRASAADSRWACDLLNRLGMPFGTRFHLQEDNSTTLE
jgi:poly-gamma-glutamate synthesis protein (capsule biosynthesis protein)